MHKTILVLTDSNSQFNQWLMAKRALAEIEGKLNHTNERSITIYGDDDYLTRFIRVTDMEKATGLSFTGVMCIAKHYWTIKDVECLRRRARI